MRKTICSLLMLLGIISICSCGDYSFDDSKFDGKGILGDYPKALAMQKSLLRSIEAKQGEIKNFGNYGSEMTPTEKKLDENIGEDMRKSLKETETRLNEKKGLDIAFNSKWKISLGEVKAEIDCEHASTGYVEIHFDVEYDGKDWVGKYTYKGKPLPGSFNVKLLDAQGNVVMEDFASNMSEPFRPSSSYRLMIGVKKAFSLGSFTGKDTPFYSKDDDERFNNDIDYLSKLDKIVKIEVSDK